MKEQVTLKVALVGCPKECSALHLCQWHVTCYRSFISGPQINQLHTAVWFSMPPSQQLSLQAHRLFSSLFQRRHCSSCTIIRLCSTFQLNDRTWPPEENQGWPRISYDELTNNGADVLYSNIHLFLISVWPQTGGQPSHVRKQHSSFRLFSP